MNQLRERVQNIVQNIKKIYDNYHSSIKGHLDVFQHGLMCGNKFKTQDFNATLFHRRARLTSAVLSTQSLSLHQLPLVY